MRSFRNDRVFGGKPVLGIATETDRRAFLRMAGLVGVGATLVAGGLGSVVTAAIAALGRSATRAISRSSTTR